MHRILLIAGALALGACGSERSGTFETGDGEGSYTIDRGGGESTLDVRGADGERLSVRSGADVEVDLPAGFAVYPGAEVVSSTEMKTGDGMGRVVTMTTDASPAEVAEFYRAMAEKAGISIQNEMNMSGTRVLSGASDSGLTFNLNAGAIDGGGTSANLMVGQGLGG